MEARKIVVVVEDVEAARTALQWALRNLFRYGDLITLLHVFPSSRSRSRNKQRILRLRSFQLALSFKDICDSVFGAKVEIVVKEGDQEGRTIASVVRETGAWALVVGVHDQSFLYKLAMAHGNVTSYLNCRVLAIKQSLLSTGEHPLNVDLTQIEIAGLWNDFRSYMHLCFNLSSKEAKGSSSPSTKNSIPNTSKPFCYNLENKEEKAESGAVEMRAPLNHLISFQRSRLKQSYSLQVA